MILLGVGLPKWYRTFRYLWVTIWIKGNWTFICLGRHFEEERRGEERRGERGERRKRGEERFPCKALFTLCSPPVLHNLQLSSPKSGWVSPPLGEPVLLCVNRSKMWVGRSPTSWQWVPGSDWIFSRFNIQSCQGDVKRADTEKHMSSSVMALWKVLWSPHIGFSHEFSIQSVVWRPSRAAGHACWWREVINPWTSVWSLVLHVVLCYLYN